MDLTSDIQKLKRNYLPEDFKVTDWASLEPYFKELLERETDTIEKLESWLRDMSELEAVVGEDLAWRQIRMTCDTENKDLEQAFNYFVMEIQPRVQPEADKLNKKLVNHPLLDQLDKEKYFTFLRNVRKSIELFREENVPLQAECSVLGQQFGVISGKMTVEVEGREYTLQQASKFLENEDRSLRESVYRKINERRLQDKEALNSLYSKLISKRHQIAKNAGFQNYRDYRFAELGRFDYGKEECFRFHDAVKEQVLPLVNTIYRHKREQLQLETLKPWDTEAQPAGVKPLTPFQTGDELVKKSISCLMELHPFFANCIRKMNDIRHLDLESRKGKAPGGYNCPLPESGAPFIFMNAAGQMDDVTTMVHEGGHAVHSFLSHNLELTAFKEYPMEIAEVASMAMELFSMEYWNVFFPDTEELRRARIHQLERVITIFPWIATIDSYQHWIYENPDHTAEERAEAWTEILNRFSSPEMDFSGLEEFRRYGWQRQLHLFEVPFYYIEYGIAQLGAIGLWKQFKENKEQALDNYIRALSLGGTRTLPELYNAAGLKFDFSPAHISGLMKFVEAELKRLM